MSQSILEAIFKGDLLTWEQRAISTDRLKELKGNVQKEHDYFVENMTDHQKRSFDDYHCLIRDIVYEEIGNQEYNSFITGILVGIDIAEYRQRLLVE